MSMGVGEVKEYFETGSDAAQANLDLRILRVTLN